MIEVSLKVFCSYSHNDEPLKDELAKHLTMLERQGVISTWHDRKIPPGKEWDQQINENLNTADIILLLVSSDFIYSKYCWDIEVTKAIERHEAGEAFVIPIILRNVSWQSAPFAKLQALPKNALPVKSWNNQDDAFTNVAQGIKFAAEQLIKERQEKQASREAAIVKYRQQAEEFASDGEISLVESEILKDLQEKLKLTDLEASAIREKALEPYGIYKKHIDKYRLFLTNFIDEQGYPLNEKAKNELKKLQQYYVLKDEDVVCVEKEQEVEYQKRQAEKLLQEQEAKLFTENLGNGVVLEMFAIPGGQFFMGSPENEPERYSDESPQHTVTVQPFFMGKFPVTQSQWAIVATLKKVNIDLNSEPSNFKGANRPVECVSWDDAVEFCARLSNKTGKNYRLPSEAEWEYACRAGTTTPFYFGETITTDLANYDGNYTYNSGSKGEFLCQTTDVGKFPPNFFGLFDMHGNVWEWCQDTWHENYNGAPTDASPWISPNENRLLRGGSWYFNPGRCRSAIRYSVARVVRYNEVGFRVVVAASLRT
ncbi:SUMF1/EgtB/PvdO family nonheme iron enzyme [Nostoc sp. UCD121]|uniref:SUMF1/EgtB/PvdO family nonheme iron enzyme n=1 Tax=unclassified Nostoc TaxID=2593658 RepID=UPI000DECF014|nr:MULTISPECIES: SUMF1/EgtB/PvdO family nonheme iron enzyme [unclassified Nostoc]MBC1222278.1 SUMF1/EgtB/PvdO family nonheme iron enzyme [Nostoc sp. UCD120]MBC1280709.1 SUMF1/EgtB/PvdO family nonheme iron enzyme [Nostoc sp. UCD121]MBC1298566.1 SUMF1/EgtB/PvdO family nonheme iron enzyme [Nostoc sp. UCD122]QHG14564.1 SUMF1/EgtB/PvdO family nonheme iron enzyme [Nostoc sp. ATCC 53789]